MGRRSKGFTLIELVTVITIASVSAGVTAPSVMLLADAMQFNTVRSELREAGRVALDRISIDIRRIENPQAVRRADADKYVFFDLDGIKINYHRNTNKDILKRVRVDDQ